MRNDKHYPGILSTRMYQNVAQKLDEHFLHVRKHTYLLLVNKHSSKFDVVKLVKVKHNKQMTGTFRLRLASEKIKLLNSDLVAKPFRKN